MDKFLVFTLTAPMGSFGDLAGYDRRGTGLWPARSAVLGLVGAALGIRRDDKEGLDALNQWNVAVSMHCEGQHLRDFHTAQAIPRSVKNINSRREALKEAGLDVTTMLSMRDYLTDILFGVALWAENPLHTLEQLKKALDEPVFTLYLVRKSCPLSAPVGAKIVAKNTPVEALAAIQIPPWFEGKSALDPENPLLVASDPHSELRDISRTEMRWDQPVDRDKWHFAQRTVVFPKLRGVS